MLDLRVLAEQQLLPGTKGLAISMPVRQGDLGRQGWSVLDGDTSFPVAVLRDSAIRHNLSWMREFCAAHQIVHAPHGKTTMSPQIFDMQLDSGAWGMTLANVCQLQVAHRFGVKRVLIANQLINPADIRCAFELMLRDPHLELFAIVDSIENAAVLSRIARQMRLNRPFPLLVELGFSSGRTGCRSMDAAMQLASAIRSDDQLCLAGVECYEGLMFSEHVDRDLERVGRLIDQLVELAADMDAAGHFESDTILISAGGSAYFDLVAKAFHSQKSWSRPMQPLLRSGCYVTHDHAMHQTLPQKVRNQAASNLVPALEIWSVVHSRPEPDLAILSMGKRDASHDNGLPVPLHFHRPGEDTDPAAFPAAAHIFKLNDQHAYLRIPADLDLRVGDLVGCGISHPCTTFDKWPLVLIVDDRYRVSSAINTFF